MLLRQGATSAAVKVIFLMLIGPTAAPSNLPKALPSSNAASSSALFSGSPMRRGACLPPSPGRTLSATTSQLTRLESGFTAWRASSSSLRMESAESEPWSACMRIIWPLTGSPSPLKEVPELVQAALQRLAPNRTVVDALCCSTNLPPDSSGLADRDSKQSSCKPQPSRALFNWELPWLPWDARLVLDVLLSSNLLSVPALVSRSLPCSDPLKGCGSSSARRASSKEPLMSAEAGAVSCLELARPSTTCQK